MLAPDVPSKVCLAMCKGVVKALLGVLLHRDRFVLLLADVHTLTQFVHIAIAQAVVHNKPETGCVVSGLAPGHAIIGVPALEGI